MLGAILRLFIAVLAIAGLAILFFYAFVAALIITPILFVLFYFLGRKQNAVWWTVQRGTHTQRPGQGPVIDHDPNDLPPPDKN
jgi:hypothetical protein